jgi:hypothetical protein
MGAAQVLYKLLGGVAVNTTVANEQAWLAWLAHQWFPVLRDSDIRLILSARQQNASESM